MTTETISAPLLTAFSLQETEQSVAARFEKQVAHYGNRIAISERGKSITYGELNRLANRMAHAINDRITTDQPARIAICMEKDTRYIAAILAVLKSGHCYVPLDPEFPEERNRFIVNEIDAELLLTSSESWTVSESLMTAREKLLNLDTIPQHQSDTNPEKKISPGALAYIIYTSGSTGNPKGVIQSQRNLLHGCMRRSNLQRITIDDRMTLLYSCSVIASVYCIFGALLNGATLYPYDIRRDGVEKIGKWLTSNRITIYHSVASVFRELARNLQCAPEELALRMVVFGGERVLTSDVNLARQVFSENLEFYTGLGATETGTMRYFQILPDTVLEGDVVPIGYPVEGVEVVLLDESGKPVAPGEIGEITVRSRYIALGYWRNEAANERAFGIDSRDSAMRIYRTGDLGQMDSDGLLRHRGRRDFQVKIRGFRVETGEVEAQLMRHPAVVDAVVIAIDIESGNTKEAQLVAYFTAKNGSHLTPRLLRNHLAARLTYYMIPSLYVQLPVLPKTPNNKVDRNRLPEPDENNLLPEEKPQPAATETQQRLLDIFASLLDKKALGINQNFFELGGHSLLASRALVAVNNAFGVCLTMRDIFAAKNFADLAKRIDALQKNYETREAADQPLLQQRTTDRVPLTPAQQRMWMAYRLGSAGNAYNIENTLLLTGNLNIAALERAIGEICRRHSVLRARIPHDDNGPWMELLPQEQFSLGIIDIRAETGNRMQLAIERARQQLAEVSALESGPLFRSHLIRVEDSSAILALVFNHIIYDNIWSSQILFRELSALYSAYSQGEEPELPELVYQFSDYALWEQQRHKSQKLASQLEYWSGKLKNLPDPVELPTESQRLNGSSSTGDVVEFEIPASLTATLREFSRSLSATPFMVVLAAWQLLLHRYSGADDITVGTPVGRRPLAATEGMIGLFINTLVLRCDFSRAANFSELVQQVRDDAIDAFSNDQVPFEDVVAKVNPPREKGRHPFFQHLFIHRMETESCRLADIEVKPLSLHTGSAKFDLTLSVLEGKEKISAALEYRTAAFSRTTAERMSRHLVTLLHGALKQPELPVDALPILDRDEYPRQSDNAPCHHPDNQTHVGLHTWIEACAKRHPASDAVVAQDQTLTYSELLRRSQLIAEELHQHGVRRGDLVAVCVPRGAMLPAALLGVLSAGAAYVPLDPDFPPERLELMLEDSAAAVALVQAGTAFITENKPNLAGIFIDSDCELFTRDPTGYPQVEISPEDLAYVIYTSGSTGKPKGVEVRHRGLVNFLQSMSHTPGLTAEDRLLAVTTVCFDIAMLELFLPLTQGASVVVLEAKAAQDPARLARALTEHQITVMQATPATWHMLLDYGWAGDQRLRIFCGGEKMGRTLATRLLPCASEVWNLYGPTETTIWSAVKRVQTPEDADNIGDPVDETQLYVLNSELQPQPPGVPGELCIGGAGLARGYRNREQLSAEKFVRNELGSTGYLYRTGDLVIGRETVDREGNRMQSIEFVGRIDNQVKIRGYRIELGEIENRIVEDPAVRDCVVIPFDDEKRGERFLAAFIIPLVTNGINVDTLRRKLRTVLPEYMIPAHFVAVDKFPLTPNRKVDRKKFENPRTGKNFGGKAQTVVPASIQNVTGKETSDIVRSIISDVVGNAVDNLDQSFFDIGGHSLSALNVIARLSRYFQVDLPTTLLFDCPTLADVVEVIDAGGDVSKTGMRDVNPAAQVKIDQVRIDRILQTVRNAENKDGIRGQGGNSEALAMRESKIAKYLLAPLYPKSRRFLRLLLEKIILKLEGGSAFTKTLRSLYRERYQIDIGDFTSVTFDPMALKRSTTIGKYCSIYRTVTFQNANHPLNTLSTHGIFYHPYLGFSEGRELDRVEITVGNDVWIGDGAKILFPTCKIGDGAVIAAGAVVVEDVPPYAVVAGYPARIVRYRFSRETIDKLQQLKWWEISPAALARVPSQFNQPLEGDRVR